MDNSQSSETNQPQSAENKSSKKVLVLLGVLIVLVGLWMVAKDYLPESSYTDESLDNMTQSEVVERIVSRTTAPSLEEIEAATGSEWPLSENSEVIAYDYHEETNELSAFIYFVPSAQEELLSEWKAYANENNFNIFSETSDTLVLEVSENELTGIVFSAGGFLGEGTVAAVVLNLTPENYEVETNYFQDFTSAE